MLLLANTIVLFFFFLRKKNMLHKYIMIFVSILLCCYINNTAYINLYRTLCISVDPYLWRFLSILNDSYASISLLFFLYFFFKKVERISSLIVCSIIYSIFKKINILSSFSGFLLNTNVNVTLMNSLLLFHPIYLYIGYVLSAYVFLFNLSTITFYVNTLALKSLISLKHILSNFTLYSGVALLLGCWWAQQELNWGGWWNWDAIEIIALLLYMLSLLLLHLSKFNTYLYLIKFIKLVPCCLVFFYFLARQDLINSIHSFVILGSKDMYVEYKFISVLFILLFTIKNSKHYLVNSIVVIFVLTFLYLYIYVIYNSLSLLLNNIVYLSEFKVVKYVFIFSILFFLWFVRNLYRLTVYFIISTFFISNWHEFIVFSLFCMFIKFFFLNSYKPYIKLLHIIYIFIICMLLYTSTLDFYFYKLSRFNSYVINYNNVNFLDYSNVFILKLLNNFYKYTLQYYTYSDVLMYKPYNTITQFRNQIICSNGVLNLNLVFFKKTLTLSQTLLVLYFFVFLLTHTFIYLVKYRNKVT